MSALISGLPLWRMAYAQGVRVAWTDEAVPPALYKELEAAWPRMPYEDPEYVRQKITAVPSVSDNPWSSFWAKTLRPESLSQLLAIWQLNQHPVSSYRGVNTLPQRFRLRGEDGDAPFYVSPSFVWRQPKEHDPVTGPHVDNPSSLCFLLWYFPCPGDQTLGGDLLFLRRKVKAPQAPTDFEVILRVPYLPNHAAFALNGPDVIHAVVPRVNATHPRRHVGITIDLAHKLFLSLNGRRMLRRSAWTADNVAKLLGAGNYGPHFGSQ